jgi:hypothetical protein
MVLTYPRHGTGVARSGRDEADLLDLIYGTVADPDRGADVLVGVSDHLGAVGGMLAYVPPRGSGQPPTQILGRLP